ncbi:MAG: efflux RND transporter permease subunit [Planctomycetes bacterium]|nr:efflux RND transporter permease subunit [Planctomycetota bacterium]
MILSDTAIRRPVFTVMVIGALIVFGAVSFRRIGIDLFPKVDFPVITIVSVLPGADPGSVETSVSEPIEEAVSTVSGIKHLRSTSTDGVSQVVIEFELEKPVDVAFTEVQSKLAGIRSALPRDLEDPVIEKFDIDSTPVMSIVVSGDMPIRKLTDLADNVVKERLQRVKNVGQVKLVGGRKRQIWVRLDPEKLEGRGLAVEDVEAAIREGHVEKPGGLMETGPSEFVVKTKAEFESPKEFESLVVAWRGGAPIRLGEVGRVDDSTEEDRSAAKLDDRRAIALIVRRQSGTNTVEVANAVKAEVEALRAELAPLGVRLEVGQDLSVFIEQSVHEVQFHMLYGGGLAILIVLVFLRNLRSTVISALVIPTAVIGTFVLMDALGFTQNMMTLLALTLAIGLLIDDSIVVQENTMRHVEMGKPPREAASFATAEIALAVFATTLSVVAVFVPVAFMRGMVGRFFYQFGMTVASAVSISMFVSFTLDPMMSSRFLRRPRHGWLYRLSEKPFLLMESVYERLLSVSLRRRWLVVLVALGAFAGAAWTARGIRSEFVPQEDQSEFNIQVTAPLGASLSRTDAVMEKIRLRLAGQPWLDYTFMTIGAGDLKRVNTGSLYVKMKAKGARAIGQSDAMAWTRAQVADITEAKVSVEIVPRVSGGGFKSAELQLELRGPDLDRLDELAQGVVGRMRAAGGYTDIDTSYEKGKPEISVFVKRDRAAELALDPLAVASTIRSLIGGVDVAKFRAGGERFDVSVRLDDAFRTSPESIERLAVRNRRGDLIRVGNVGHAERTTGPVQINRYNRTRVITIYANLVKDKKVLGEAVAEMKEFIRDAGLPPGTTAGFAGNAEMMQETAINFAFTLTLAVILVYMVLAAQFESFIHPFTIMLSLPLSIVGALGALLLTNTTLSIFTMIGIIMLMGLVTKNGILLVDYTITLRSRDGLPRDKALLTAGPARLRPVLMTTFALVFGMLPIALGTGEGSETRAPMAIAVIGGLIASTLLTLVVVPVVYSLLDDAQRLVGLGRGGRSGGEPGPESTGETAH